MPMFERGARVQHVAEQNNSRSRKPGTVTHLHGDPNYEMDVNHVWVQFDHGGAGWIEVKLLIPLKK